MSRDMLRVLVADDERPARAFLVKMLRAIAGVTVVAEAVDGADAVQRIEEHRPDVALLDLQMPEVNGLEVVRLLRRDAMPLVIFVTAFDEYAVRAFEMNAVDYLTKPVTEARLGEAFRRVRDRLGRRDVRLHSGSALGAAQRSYDRAAGAPRLTRIPVRHREEIVLVPVPHLVSVVAEGELLHLTTTTRERYTFGYRLKDLEARLDPARFVRLSRGTLVAIDQIARVIPLPGGLYTAVLRNGDQHDVSRIQSRLLRQRLLLL
jgi:two-component system LytT family response regulator